MPSPEGYAVAMLIAAVGIDIDTEYGLEESMAYAYDLQGFLIRMPSKMSLTKHIRTVVCEICYMTNKKQPL